MIYIEKAVEKQIDITSFYTYYHHFFGKNQFFPGQRHPFWEVNIVLNGSMTLTCDDLITTLSKGQMFLIRPEQFHSFITLEDRTEFLVLTFSMDFTAPNAAYALSDANMRLAYTLMEEMESRYQGEAFLRSDASAPQTLKLLMELLILRAISHDAVPCTKNMYSDIYQTAVQFMKVNIFSPITLNDIARHCGVSCSTLKALFKTHTQLGVMHFFSELKMEKAKEMLASGSSVSAAADELRFSSTAHFSAAFKKYAGLSPLQYKKQPLLHPRIQA